MSSQGFVALSEDISEAVRELLLEEPLDEAISNESIQDALKTLRWLNNLPSAEMPIEEWLDDGTPEDLTGKAWTLLKLVRIFARNKRKVRKKQPAINMLTEEATNAAAAMAMAVAEYAQDMLPEGHPQVAALDKVIASLPPQAEMRQSQSVTRLASWLSTGFDRIVGRPIDRSPHQQLLEIGARMQETVRKFRTVDTMEEPAREESIELAREILRKLKNLSFSDKPVEAMIDAGKPEEKVETALRLDELAQMYMHLVVEAAKYNPNIFKDRSIQEGSDAASVFTHAIKLMAAKEIPVSLSASQQISADITQTPEEWNKLHHQAVNRLLQSMEGGVERAFSDIQSQQQQQDDDIAQEAIEAALSHADGSHRKKRKRKHHRSGLGGKKQKKERLALEADDYVLKQGRFARDTKSVQMNFEPFVMPGLKPDALAAVKALGDSLLRMGEQLKDIKAPSADLAGGGGSNKVSVSNVGSNDKISPNDKTISQRIIEEHQQRSQKNLQGPGV